MPYENDPHSEKSCDQSSSASGTSNVIASDEINETCRSAADHTSETSSLLDEITSLISIITAEGINDSHPPFKAVIEKMSRLRLKPADGVDRDQTQSANLHLDQLKKGLQNDAQQLGLTVEESERLFAEGKQDAERYFDAGTNEGVACQQQGSVVFRKAAPPAQTDTTTPHFDPEGL